jgi:hypothetical protein
MTTSTFRHAHHLVNLLLELQLLFRNCEYCESVNLALLSLLEGSNRYLWGQRLAHLKDQIEQVSLFYVLVEAKLAYKSLLFLAKQGNRKC